MAKKFFSGVHYRVGFTARPCHCMSKDSLIPQRAGKVSGCFIPVWERDVQWLLFCWCPQPYCGSSAPCTWAFVWTAVILLTPLFDTRCRLFAQELILFSQSPFFPCSSIPKIMSPPICHPHLCLFLLHCTKPSSWHITAAPSPLGWWVVVGCVGWMTLGHSQLLLGFTASHRLSTTIRLLGPPCPSPAQPGYLPHVLWIHHEPATSSLAS